MVQFSFFLYISAFFLVQFCNSANDLDVTTPNNLSREQETVIRKKPIGNRVQDALATAKTYVTENIQKIVDRTVKKGPEKKVVVIRNHTRLKRWMFNKNFRKDKSKKDILYHTFHPIANYFIERYGKKEAYNSGKFSGIKHSLNGIIEYPQGKKQNVIFSITKDNKGYWYHREIKFHNPKKLHISSEAFEPKIMYYKFGDKGAIRSIVYFENGSWVKIFDAANDVTLYLKK